MDNINYNVILMRFNNVCMFCTFMSYGLSQKLIAPKKNQHSHEVNFLLQGFSHGFNPKTVLTKISICTFIYDHFISTFIRMFARYILTLLPYTHYARKSCSA